MYGCIVNLLLLLLPLPSSPQLKADFESKMVWGESEMKRGSNPAFEPCAKPGCTPFPQCCTTTGSRGHLKYKPHTSRAVE